MICGRRPCIVNNRGGVGGVKTPLWFGFFQVLVGPIIDDEGRRVVGFVSSCPSHQSLFCTGFA